MRFQGHEVVTREPEPDANQVWLAPTGNLIKVVGFCEGNLNNVLCMNEIGTLFTIPRQWFDGSTYRLMGIIKEEVSHV